MLRSLRAGATCLALAAGLAACGGTSDADQVRATVTTFRDATAKKDFVTICRRVLAPALVARLAQLGVPCELALSKYLTPTREPRLDVSRVAVTGSTARAYVSTGARNQRSALSVVRLVKVKAGWRISALTAPR